MKNRLHILDELFLFSKRIALVESGASIRRSLTDQTPIIWAFSSSESGKGEKETVKVKRRRRTTSESLGERQRAEAPRRRRTDQQPQSPPAGGGGGYSGVPRPPSLPSLPSGGQLFGGGKPNLLIIGIVVICLFCVVGAFLLMGQGGFGDDQVSSLPQITEKPAFQLQDTATQIAPAVAFTPPAVSSEGQKWLVMLYQDADDKILEKDIYLDLNEAEKVGSSDRVQIVTQMDRYKGGYQGDGNWTSTRRYYVTQDDDLQRLGSQLVADLGEKNMAAGDTLEDFAVWAIETFPADKFVLILSDHGLGWPGGWSDPDPAGRGEPSIPLASHLGNQLYLMELEKSLDEVRSRTGIEQFELVGLDACLMGHLEVFSALSPHARYAVASQEIEPALGWAYTGFLEDLKRNPDMDGATLASQIVKSYVQSDQRIVDEKERSEFLRQGSPMGGLFGMLGQVTPQQLANQLEANITLSAVDLKALPSVLNQLNKLSYTLQQENQQVVAKARNYSQSFTSVFGNNVPPSYIDLGNFARLLRKETTNDDVIQAVDGVIEAISQAVIAEKHGPKVPGASGISIYFPNSQLFRTPQAGPQSYTAIADRFSLDSLWDEFLVYHYSGRNFEPKTGSIAIPEPDEEIIPPGAGEIEVSAVQISSQSVAPGQVVTMKADISGENIGYAYLFVGFYDRQSNSIYIADIDYLESSNTREIDGVYYPDWGDRTEFTLEYDWEPILFAIDDGEKSALAMFNPESYGKSFEETIYTVDGEYTYADSGDIRYARLYFNDGLLRQVFGFTHQDFTGAPREITPQSGDQFTILEKWMDLDSQGNVVDTAFQEGETLTFGDQMFTWEELDAAQGEYIIGFIIEDLDGKSYEAYTPIRVN